MKAKRITRKDVAERAGVSVAVVSYVVNDGPRPVSPETRARVEIAIDELGYYPNELARSLRSRQTSTIGLLIPRLTNPVYAEIAESLQSVCAQEGYLVLAGASGRNQVQEEEFVRMVRAKQVDGVVMIPSHAPMELIWHLQQAHIPVVILEHDLPGIHCIDIDDLNGGLIGTNHLLDMGHRRVGLIKRKPSSANSSQRYDGYRQALEDEGIPFDCTLVVESGAGYTAGCQAMGQLLALPEPPTAVFTHNDVLAIGAMHAIHSAGLLIPENISVVGYDNTISSVYSCPPLTTVKFPKSQMGDLAAHTVLQLARHEEELPARTITLPAELVVRESTAPPP
ncbi:MAG: LacI family DNA-binding transcriptional regulator [Chloroflexota bacterium]|nr:LacI family DNA-binding transcriptional regulator [Chloroflexota bacterium]